VHLPLAVAVTWPCGHAGPGPQLHASPGGLHARGEVTWPRREIPGPATRRGTFRSCQSPSAGAGWAERTRPGHLLRSTAGCVGFAERTATSETCALQVRRSPYIISYILPGVRTGHWQATAAQMGPKCRSLLASNLE
jgi:hypothetical protein